MTPQEKIDRAIELLASAQAELAAETGETRGNTEAGVAEFLKAETVANLIAWSRPNFAFLDLRNGYLMVNDTNGLVTNSMTSCGRAGIVSRPVPRTSGRFTVSR